MVNSEKILEAAMGFMELGMPGQAWKEWRDLPPSQRNSVHALQVKCAILMHLERWTQALQTCRKLQHTAPEDWNVYIQTAFCLHELKRTEDAKSILAKSPQDGREQPVWHYNMACYETQLGDLTAARKSLEKCLALDSHYKDLALHDPDLAPLLEATPDLIKS